jgi:hypothetical protein
MYPQLPVARPARRPQITQGSFQEELSAQLARRCKWVYLFGFLITFVIHLFYRYIVEFHPPVDTLFTPWILSVYDLYVFSLGLTAIAFVLAPGSFRQLLVIDFAAIAFNILLSCFIAVVFDLNEIPTFAIALLLFFHAAVIPVPVGHQVGLAVVAVLGYPAAIGLAYAFIPEIGAFWSGRPEGEGVGTLVLEGTFQLAILAAVSVVITKALYHMRKTLHAAERLGDYIIEDKLGRGGMGEVFLAQHALMCRPTAVKIMNQASRDESETATARFEREVRLSAGLTHPNTITIYDFGRTSEGSFYYAMEYLKGLDLQDLVGGFGPVGAERAVFILTQICGSLAEAHACGIVHRDVKPSNIFLTCRGGLCDFVKVLDFGLAKQLEAAPAADLTVKGEVFGTPLYIAPEMVEDAGSVDCRADLYSLGAVAFWMLTARPLFVGGTSIEIIVHHVKSVPERPSDVSEMSIPAAVDEIVMRCLEKDPDA